MLEDVKGIYCLGFLRGYFCLRESKTGILIWKSDNFKEVADAFKVRRCTDIWQKRLRHYTPHNRANHNGRRPGETRLVCVGPAGEVGRLPRIRNQPFLCPTHSTWGYFEWFFLWQFKMHSLISYSEVTIVEVVIETSILSGTTAAHLKDDLSYRREFSR